MLTKEELDKLRGVLKGVSKKHFLVIAFLISSLVLFPPSSYVKNGIISGFTLLKAANENSHSLIISIGLFIIGLIVFKWVDVIYLFRRSAINIILVAIAVGAWLTIDIKWPLNYYGMIGLIIILFIAELIFFLRNVSLENEKQACENSKCDDDPLDLPADDKLNRAWFTKSIFEMILRSKDSNMRIALTGEWGSGKTSCLQFIGYFAKENDYPVVYFDAWRFNNRKEAWKGFIAAIDSGIAKWKGISIGPFKRNSILISLLKIIVKEDKIIGEVGKWFNELLIAKLEASFEETKEFVSEKISCELKGKKLIVLIDDLDRASAEVVYEVLLMIKEIIDVRGCVFVCGFDKVATFNILDNYNIKEHQLFIDKIFQRQFEIPKANVNQLTQDLLSRYPIRHEIIKQYKDNLPQNPRKLKSYFRQIDSLHNCFLFRFGDDDLNWEVLYLAELLKLEFPKALDLLLNEPTFFDKFKLSIFDDEKVENQKLEEWQRLVSPLFEQEQSRLIDFNGLLNKLLHLSALLSKESFQYHFRVLSHPEVLTWKEYREWRLKGRSTILEFLKNNVLPIEQRREFIRSIMRERNQVLAQESEVLDHEERISLISKAIELTKESLWYIEQPELHQEENPMFNDSIVLEYFSSLNEWSHFESAFYNDIRQLERDVAIALCNRSTKFAPYILKRLPAEPLGRRETKFKETLIYIVKTYKSSLIKVLINGMKLPNTMKDLWGASSHWEEKRLFTQLDQDFYSLDNKQMLLDLAQHSSTDKTIHSNFVEMLRLLLYATEPDSSFDNKEALKVLEDDEIRELLWNAVTARRIHHRMVGTLLDYRRKLATRLKKKEIMPIPSWMLEFEPDLIEEFKIHE